MSRPRRPVTVQDILAAAAVRHSCGLPCAPADLAADFGISRVTVGRRLREAGIMHTWRRTEHQHASTMQLPRSDIFARSAEAPSRLLCPGPVDGEPHLTARVCTEHQEPAPTVAWSVAPTERYVTCMVCGSPMPIGSATGLARAGSAPSAYVHRSDMTSACLRAAA